MTDEQSKYMEFMCDHKNIGNCANCPENRGFEQGAARIVGPCGQQNCWVAIHSEEEN